MEKWNRLKKQTRKTEMMIIRISSHDIRMDFGVKNVLEADIITKLKMKEKLEKCTPVKREKIRKKLRWRKPIKEIKTWVVPLVR